VVIEMNDCAARYTSIQSFPCNTTTLGHVLSFIVVSYVIRGSPLSQGLIGVVIGPHLPTAYCYRPSSVVCQSVTLVSPAKSVEPIEMPFGLRTQVGQRNHVLDGSLDPPMERGNFEGRGGPL